MAATGCVIERIGDFELEPQHEGPGTDAAPTKLDAESLYLKSR